MPRGKVFYGWWVVAAGFGLEALIGALFFHAYGAYAVLLREEFGWSKTMLSAAFSEVHRKTPAIVKHTAEKFGKKRAEKQRTAIALSKARRGG